MLGVFLYCRLSRVYEVYDVHTYPEAIPDNTPFKSVLVNSLLPQVSGPPTHYSLLSQLVIRPLVSAIYDYRCYNAIVSFPWAFFFSK